jgi:hypothetical protein
MLKPHQLNNIFFTVANGLTLGFAIYGTQVAGLLPLLNI